MDDEGRVILHDVTVEDMQAICAFINSGGDEMRSHDVLAPLIDRFLIEGDILHKFTIYHENWMREHMYDEAYTDTELCTDLYYGLKFFTDERGMRTALGAPDATVSRYDVTHNDLFHDVAPALKLNSWENIQRKLNVVREVARIPGVFVAGGYIFSALYGTNTDDVDIFLVDADRDVTDETLIERINEIIRVFQDNLPPNCVMEGYHQYTRTAHAITFTCTVHDSEDMQELLQRKCKTADDFVSGMIHDFSIQVILRSYRSPSEVLHGFDVDSCCLGYDGERIYLTARAQNALRKGINTVDFGRLSPSYEYRLVKYATRGMIIRIPDFDRLCVDSEAIAAEINSMLYDGVSQDPWPHTAGREKRYRAFHRKVFGLNRLLVLEDHFRVTPHKKHMQRAFEELTREHSDYCTRPYQATEGYQQGQHVDELLMYMGDLRCRVSGPDEPGHCEMTYPDEFAQYKPFIDARVAQLEAENPENIHRDENYMGRPTVNIVNIRTSPVIGIPFSGIGNKKLNFIRTHTLNEVLAIDENIYGAMAAACEWRFPRVVTFKRIQPGEQTTSTFHQIVLADTREWYKGKFYHVSETPE
jgi:hypothetical protein